MNFKDWLSSDYSEIWTSDGMDGARQAWDYKQDKIDAVLALLETTQSNESTALSDNNFLKLKIKEILK
ncbi:hypothetical protein GNVKYODX_CDS61 [Acinetobacter phage vB_AbaM_AB3P2]|nr:hypothetical protein GNVKYODX_CDS61 [Acinetobacter phage vB_AbaM_AB3P2]